MKNLISFVMLALFFYGCGGSDDGKVEGTGTIEIVASVISAKMAGEVKKIVKDEGMTVRKGDTLIIIDAANYIIQQKMAQANLKLAEGAYELLRNGARKEDVEVVLAQLKQAEINIKSAETDFERFRELLSSKSVTQKQFDDAEARYNIAQEQLNAAKESAKKIKNISRPEELKQALARVEQAAANEELLRKQISDCYIIAPFDGLITKKYVQEGETIAPSAAVLKLANTETAELTIYIPETDMPKIKPGNKAFISIDMNPDKKYEGYVSFISAESEFTPKNIQTKDERTKLVFAVKIKIPNKNYELKSGLPADAEIIVN